MVNVRMQPPEVNRLAPKITVVGVGGAGGNAVNNMINSGLEGTDFVVCNTDAQALQNCLAEHKIQLGENITGGLGAGAKPDVGRAAAEESLEEVLESLEGANMVFVTAGMGGGTGTGAAPVIARAARDQGMLTVGVVTKPFHFEGTHRMKMAEQGIEEMQDYVDTLIVIPNQNLFRIANEKTTFAEAFKMADTVLQSGVRGVTDLMVMPGLINLDFADIRSAMQEMGKAMMGTGEAEGERRAIEAAEAAISNPLLDDVSMKGARGVIINITGGYDMTLFEADEACNRIRDEVDPDANIIFGSTFDETLEGVMRVSVVATGIDAHEAEQPISRGDAGGGLKVVAGQQGKQASGQSLNQQTINSQTQAIRYERAKPQTVQATSSFPYVARVSSAIQQAAQQPMTQGNAALARQPEQESLDEVQPQQSQAHDHEQERARQGSTIQTATQVSEQSTVPRAQRMGDSFIPPQPVDPSRVDNLKASDQLQGSSDRSEAPQPAPAASAPQDQQKNLQPQQKQRRQEKQTDTQPRVQPRTSPSEREDKQSAFGHFINRLTGGGQNQSRQEKTGDDDSQTPAKPSQGKLNIDAPAAVPNDEYEDELDIPAFLRRQAN